MTQIHRQTQGGEGGRTSRGTKMANTHSVANGSAQTHTWVAFSDGCACLQLVLGIFFDFIFWSHVRVSACRLARTLLQNNTECYCFSGRGRLIPDAPADSAADMKPELAQHLRHTFCVCLLRKDQRRRILFCFSLTGTWNTKNKTTNLWMSHWSNCVKCLFFRNGLTCTQDYEQNFWCN